MKLFFVVLGLAFLPLSSAINCDVDEVLANLTEYSYSLPVDANNLTYWRSRHLNFEVFGSFSDVDDAVINAGYYTAEDQLVYGVTVDCAASTWTSTVSVQGGSGEEGTFETGSVTCGVGSWDLWLKVEQPYHMNWIFNGTALQVGTEYIPSKFRTQSIKVPTKYGSHKAKTLKLTTTTSAPMTRFTFGECISYPEGMACGQTQSWVLTRSKSSTKLSVLGADNIYWIPKCVTGTDYYWHVQTNVHTTRTNGRNSICCCVDMETGLVPNGDSNTYCIAPSNSYDCLDLCKPWYQSGLYAEGDNEVDSTIFTNYYSIN